MIGIGACAFIISSLEWRIGMVLLGTLVNAALIVIGSIIGRLLKGIPENMKQTVMSAIGIAVVVLGIQMSFESDNFVLVIICLVFGGVIGEWIDLDKWLNRLGQYIEVKFGSKDQGGSIAQGFVTGTLIFVIGAMGVLGALNGGLRNDHELLISKGIIDGFTSIILAATLGIGVVTFSNTSSDLSRCNCIVCNADYKNSARSCPRIISSRNDSHWRDYDYCNRHEFTGVNEN